jgi:hypothetical protein
VTSIARSHVVVLARLQKVPCAFLANRCCFLFRELVDTCLVVQRDLASHVTPVYRDVEAQSLSAPCSRRSSLQRTSAYHSVR